MCNRNDAEYDCLVKIIDTSALLWTVAQYNNNVVAFKKAKSSIIREIEYFTVRYGKLCRRWLPSASSDLK